MLDGPLSRLVDRNRIRVGDKLCVFGSDLVGSNDATTPLEVFSEFERYQSLDL